MQAPRRQADDERGDDEEVSVPAWGLGGIASTEGDVRGAEGQGRGASVDAEDAGPEVPAWG